MKLLILSTAAILWWSANSFSQQISVPGSDALLLKEYVFESSPHFQSCHAASILELPDGELLCAFFAGTRESHPDVEIWLSRKPMGGKWTDPVSVADGDEPGGERMSTGNPVLFRERGGEIILFYKVIKPGVGFVGRLKRSEDGGHTWSEAHEVGNGLMGAVKNKPVQLEDGTILSPSSTEDDHGWRVHIERSTDGGQTWELIGPVNPEARIGAIQPTLMTYPDGSIQMYCRTRSEHGFIAQSWSRDGGRTWSPLEAAILPNNNSGLDAVTLRNGRQLLVYNHSTRTQEGMGHKGRGILNVSLSRDGIHWEASMILEHLDQSGKQFSYPSVIQSRDGLVHIVYTWHRDRIKHVVLDPEKLKSMPMPDGKWPETGPFSLETFLAGKSSMQLAFPEAEGYGKYSKGGRGGAVYEVTNLNDSGPGSLRAAVDAPGPRTVVFRVSGNIELESPIKIEHPYITIAGQTAPGDGICLKNHQLSINADHVIIRHIRVRLGDLSGKDYDAVGGRYISNVILDHVSASWSVDETMSIYRVDSITVQWCIISESMFKSNHIKGYHGFGGIWGGNYATYHHNLLAHHASRNPRWASGVGFTDYRNNVIYNWGYNSCYGGERIEDSYPDQYNSFTVNMVANYYKPGPATEPGQVSHRIASPAFDPESDMHGKWHVEGNFMEGNPAVSADNWNGGIQTKDDQMAWKKLKLDLPWPSMPVNQQTAKEAYQVVLANAGAILPSRDPVDARIIRETREGIATFEGAGYKETKKVANPEITCGIIDSQRDVGGWPELESEPAPRDSDHDGMPDEWEVEHGLNKENPEDRNLFAPDGYTMLEKYLNTIN